MEVLGPDDRYELRSRIVQAARSTIHHALDRQRRVPVIVKRFTPAAHLPEYASIVAALKQADIPGLLLPQELVLSPDPFAVYPAVAGEPLESALRNGAMQWARAAQLVSEIAAVLAAVARATGHTHRNLKPGNVWLTPDGEPRILDLGSAVLGPPGPVRRGADMLEYRAPEQLDGSPGDARSDVFTLATLLVELTTGIHPFVGATPFQAAHKLTRTPPDLAELTRGMSSTCAREVAAYVTRALASNPDDRPPDAAAFATKLDYIRSLVGAPAPPRPARPAAPERPPEPVHPVADPTTIMQLPMPRRPAAKPTPEPAAPETPPSSPLTDPAAPRFAPHTQQAAPDPTNEPPLRPVPADISDFSHELPLRPVPADISDFTHELPYRPAAADRPGPAPTPEFATLELPLRPVTADSTELDPRPLPRPVTATRDLTREPLSPVPTDRTELDPRPRPVTATLDLAGEPLSPVPADITSPPLVAPEPAIRARPLRTAGQATPNRPLARQRSLADRTERNIQPRDDDATRALPRRAPARPPAPAADELATIALPRGLRRPPPDPAESTMRLPDTPAEPAPGATLVLPDTADRPDSSTSQAIATPPAQPALAVSPRIGGLLIGLNVLCVVALVLLVIAML